LNVQKSDADVFNSSCSDWEPADDVPLLERLVVLGDHHPERGLVDPLLDVDQRFDDPELFLTVEQHPVPEAATGQKSTRAPARR
jgi:hypothetical protein